MYKNFVYVGIKTELKNRKTKKKTEEKTDRETRKKKVTWSGTAWYSSCQAGRWHSETLSVPL